MGNVIEETQSYIDIHRPVKVVLMMKEPNSVGISFTKWEPISDFEFPFRLFKQSLVGVSEPTEEFKEHYNILYAEFDKKDEPEPVGTVDDLSDTLDELERMMKSLGMTPNTTHTLH